VDIAGLNLTEREKQLVDIVGRMTLAASEMTTATLSLVAFVLDKSAPESGETLADGTKRFSADDVESILHAASGASAQMDGAEGEAAGPPNPRVFGSKRRALDAEQEADTVNEKPPEKAASQRSKGNGKR
jgi:hypothetical protein